jgi:hypothetical protein
MLKHTPGLFLMSIVPQLTVTTAWLWRHWLTWPIGWLVTVVVVLCVFGTGFLMLLIALLPPTLDQMTGNKRPQNTVSHLSILFGWLSIAALGYGPLAVMWLHVAEVMSVAQAYVVGIAVAVVTSIFITSLIAASWMLLVFAVAILGGISVQLDKLWKTTPK